MTLNQSWRARAAASQLLTRTDNPLTCMGAQPGYNERGANNR